MLQSMLIEINLPGQINLPIELLPTILVLHNQKLSGLWFYDYRLRSSDFHRGGPHYIQRFRSVIEPLGWFRSLMNEDLVVEYQNNRLDIYSDQGAVKCILRGHPTERILIANGSGTSSHYRTRDGIG